MSDIKKVPLSLSRNYVRNWGVVQGVRELIANALDQEDYDIFCDGGISIHSYGGTIPENYLLLGNGSKTESTDSIGQFNEGLKIALLVLCREGVEVIIQNGKDKWVPTLEHSEIYNTECLHINIESDYYQNEDCVKIEIQDLDDELIEEIEQNTLAMQGNYEKHTTPHGDILLNEEHKGKIYVGGLFVDNFKSDYGFDFPPTEFALDRDRKSLKPFDIKWQTQYLWEYVSKQEDEDLAKQILEGIDNKDESFEYASVSCTNSLKKEAENLYNDKYSGKVVVSTYDEYKENKEVGNNVELVNNSKLVNIIHQTDCYKTFSLNINKVENKTIEDILFEYKEKWESDMTSDMLYDFEDMADEIHKKL